MIMAAIDRIAMIVGIFTYPGVSARKPARSRVLKAASPPVGLIFNPEWFLLRLVYPLGPLRVYQRQRREEHVC